MADSTTNHGLNLPIPWDEGNDDENVWGDLLNNNFSVLDELVPHEIASTTVTVQGGQKENEFTLNGVTTNQLLPIDVVVSVNADPAFDADYAWHTNVIERWDDASQHKDVIVEVVWEVDPGIGNDVDIYISVRDKAL